MYTVWFRPKGNIPNPEPLEKVATLSNLAEARVRFRQHTPGRNGTYYLLAGEQFLPDDGTKYVDSYDVR